jgi:hypothetical protein
MFLIDRWSAKSRWQFASAFAAVTLVASTAGAIPQAQAGGGGTRTSVVRTRSCSDCAEDAAMRRAREILRMKLDSLRWEIDHRQLNEAERRLAAKELMETISALEASMENSARTRAIMVIEAEAAQAASRAMAVAVQSGGLRGYIGVTFDGLWAKPPGATEDNLIRFYEYPRIALVDASSPAERGGVLVGDTLVALNGDDVRENEIAFGKLLIPHKRVTMRVRRDGSPRDLVVTVAEAPDFYVRRVSPPRAPVAAAPRSPDAPGRVQVYSPAPGVRGAQPPVILQWFGDALAGARLETVSGGLARALDVREGVLVIRTVPGTATYDSGLREGDVVTRVGDARVRSVSELQRALTGHDERERERTLVIVRDRKERRITLRW